MSDVLNGKVVLITGATGALGSAVTRTFSQTQAYLALTGRSEDKLAQLSAEIGTPPGHVFVQAADVTQAADVDTLVMTVAAHFGRPIDVLHFGTCVKLAMETAECPIDFDAMKATLESKFGIQVVLGTHSY